MQPKRPFQSCLGRLAADTTAGVTTIATLALPLIIGAAGLAVDLNRGYDQRIMNQRAADMGALGAAMAFKATSDTAVLDPTATDIARANGLVGASVDARLVSNFPSSGDQAVSVVVATPVPFMLARVLGLEGSYTVRASSVASLTSGETFSAPCYLALANTKSALTVTGGATIDAPGCSVAAIGTIDNKGTRIAAKDIISGSGDVSVNHGAITVGNTLRFAGSFSFPNWNTAVPEAKKRVNKATTLGDPWAADATLTAARAQLGAYAAPPTLAEPTTTGTADWNFDYSPKGAVAAWRVGTTNEYKVPAGTYDIKKLTVAGGIKLSFADGSIIRVKNGVAIGGGSTVNFGNSDLYVNGGFDSGSSGVTIGNGVLWLGSGAVTFSGTSTKGNGDVFISSTLSLSGGARLTMGAGTHRFGGLDLSGGGSVRMGNGDFSAGSGIKISGDSELAIGNGDIRIGPGNGNTAIKLAGSARLFMGDGSFSANGDIDTAGGSRLVFGKTTNHYINGGMKIAGAVLFGAGRYTINGDFENGTGGTTWPYTSGLTGLTYGSTSEGVSVAGYDMAGANVTFILSGLIKLAGGARTKLLAPLYTTSGGEISEMLLSSLATGNANWTGGSVNAFAGTIHLPKADVKMAGGNSTVDAGQCMSLIAYTITANGGAATGTACRKMGDLASTAGATTIRLLR